MTKTKTRQQLALDLLLRRAEGKLTSSLSFNEDFKPLVQRAVHAANDMFESRISNPFLVSGNKVQWNSRWLDDNRCDKLLLPSTTMKEGKYRTEKRSKSKLIVR